MAARSPSALRAEREPDEQAVGYRNQTRHNCTRQPLTSVGAFTGKSVAGDHGFNVPRYEGACEAGGTCFLGDPLGALQVINRRGEGRVLFRGPRSLQARPSQTRTSPKASA